MARVVGIRLRQHDHHEDRRVPDARDRDVAHLGAEPAQRLHRRLERARHLGLHVVEEVVARHADLEPAHAGPERRGVIGHGLAARRRVGRVVARERLQHQRAVLDRARHRPRVIERPRERQHTGAAHAPVRRLQADDAAERCRASDGSAGVGSQRANRQPSRERRAGPARRSAGDVIEVPRIARGLVAMSGELDAEGELVRDELAEHHHAGLGEARDARRVEIRHPVREQRGAAGGEDALGRVEVLVRDRDAGEGTRFAAADRGLGLARIGERVVGRDGDIAVQLLVELVDARQVRRRHVDRGELAASIAPAELGDAEIAELSGGHGDLGPRPRRTSARARG